MKIAFLFRSFTIIGGLEKILIDKMNYFADFLGYEVLLLTYEQGNHPIVFPLSPKVKHIDLNILFYRRYQFGLLKRSWIFIRMRKDFRKAIKEEINSFRPDFTICTTYSYLDIETILHLKDKSKKIIETHSAKEAIGKKRKYQLDKKPVLIAIVLDWVLYKLISKCSALVTLTQNDALSWKNLKKTVVIPNVLSYYPLKIKYNPSSRKIITVGRLSEEKGYDLLIRSWRLVHQKHPEWSLEIYGSGKEKETLLRDLIEYKIEKSVAIHEPINYIYKKYMESSFFVMSSRYEGFGLVLAEAMSCGIPCISFNCPHGPSEIIKDGEDGILVQEMNIEILSNKICFMIENEDIRIKMGIKARENVKRFLSENVMPKWIELFNTLLYEE